MLIDRVDYKTRRGWGRLWLKKKNQYGHLIAPWINQTSINNLWHQTFTELNLK